jgi:hypothetical protein
MLEGDCRESIRVRALDVGSTRFYLVALPLAIATIGWAAAAATARLRHAGPLHAARVTRSEVHPTRRQLGAGLPGANLTTVARRRRIWYVVLCGVRTGGVAHRPDVPGASLTPATPGATLQ